MQERNLEELKCYLIAYIRGLRDDLDNSIEAFVSEPSDNAKNDVSMKMKELKGFMGDLIHIKRRLDSINSSGNNG